MSTFGLVHGGGLGAWCWEPVLPLLEKRGYKTATVDLINDKPTAGAADFAEIILKAFADIGDLIVVGHSNSGLIIPLVATQRPVERLIFLHSLLPKPTQSVTDQFQAEPDMINPEMLSIKGNWWEDEAVVTHFLFHDCPPEVAHQAFTRLRPESSLLTTEITPLKSWPDVPCSYIVCLKDRTATPAWARRAARERLGIEPLALDSGHSPFLACPEQLVEALISCV
jgi:pimeloyl-ACP methyl ester carboxylesterase